MACSTLPLDVLASIFLDIVVEIYSASPSNAPKNRVPITCYAANLSAVCSHWRFVALFTPRMWSYIEITYVERPQPHWIPHSSFLQLCLSRANHVSLNIRVESPHNLPLETSRAWDAMSTQMMPTVGVLEVVSEANRSSNGLQLGGTYTLMRCLLHPTPRLTRLKYHLQEPPMDALLCRFGPASGITVDGWDKLCGRILPRAPYLVDLELNHLGGLQLDVFPPATLRGLRRFACRSFIPAIRISDILACAPYLERLQLCYNSASISFGTESGIVPAQDLVSVYGNANVILAQLDSRRAPNIHTLRFHPQLAEFDHNLLERFFCSTPYPALKYLALPPMYFCADEQIAAVVPLFRYMPNIRTLVMPNFPSVDPVIQNWARPEHVALLPRLQIIKSNMGSDAVSFFNFLEARRATFPELCDSQSRLAMTIELRGRQKDDQQMQVCLALAPYVATVRIVLEEPSHPDGRVLMQVCNGVQWSS